MDWDDIGRENLNAARRVQEAQPRSSVSRAYYAVHSVLAKALTDAGYVPPVNRQTPPHEAQPKLVARYLAHLGRKVVRELRSTIRRLYAARLDADYNRRVSIADDVSLQAVRDAYAVFLMLKVTP